MRFWWAYVVLQIFRWWWMVRRVDPALRWWLELELRLGRAAELLDVPDVAQVFATARDEVRGIRTALEVALENHEERSNGRW